MISDHVHGKLSLIIKIALTGFTVETGQNLIVITLWMLCTKMPLDSRIRVVLDFTITTEQAAGQRIFFCFFGFFCTFRAVFRFGLFLFFFFYLSLCSRRSSRRFLLVQGRLEDFWNARSSHGHFRSFDNFFNNFWRFLIFNIFFQLFSSSLVFSRTLAFSLSFIRFLWESRVDSFDFSRKVSYDAIRRPVKFL